MAKKTQWLSGAAWLPEAGQSAKPLPAQYKIVLRPAFEASLPAHRKDRLYRKLRRGLDDSNSHRSGDFILYAASRWSFRGANSSSGDGFVHQGGLSTAAMQIPFLFASRLISDSAESDLRAAPLELTDVAPTVHAILGIPATTPFARPAILKWRTDQKKILDFVQADRQIKLPASDPAPRLTWSETQTEVKLGLTESAKHWPPDDIVISFAERSYRWDPDKAEFPKGAPCTYRSDKIRRNWSCRFTLDGTEDKIAIATALRGPNPVGKGVFKASQPFVLGTSIPSFENAQLVCADGNRALIRVQAKDLRGLWRSEAGFSNAAQVDSAADLSTMATSQFHRAEKTGKCASGDPSCAIVDLPKAVDTVLNFALPAKAVRRIRWASKLVGRYKKDRKRARRIFGASFAKDYDGQQPTLAWLTVRVCNTANICRGRVVATDADYRAVLVKSCDDSLASPVQTKEKQRP